MNIQNLEKHADRTDIIDNIRANSYAHHEPLIKTEYDVKIVRKIISLYLEYMIITIFSGKTWMLPRKFGFIKITRNVVKYENRMPFNTRRHFTGVGGKRLYNPKAPGIIFRLEIKSDFLKKHKCRFRASDKLKKLIFKESFYGDLAKIIS